MNTREITIKDRLSVLAFAVAATLAFIGCFLPPQGEVSDSLLYLIAQFLIFAATLLGLGVTYKKISNLLKVNNDGHKTEAEENSEKA